MWAGSRSSNSDGQSAKGVRKTTVTVRPSFEPVSEAMSRYPSVDATESGVPSTSVAPPFWDCQAYMKSAALMGTPSDHTARGSIW